jgi:hypothetical protein
MTIYNLDIIEIAVCKIDSSNANKMENIKTFSYTFQILSLPKSHVTPFSRQKDRI